jgi:hypothetical protein
MLAVFVLLLAGKVWSWIGEGRVDILEQQPPQNPRLFHARLASSLLVSTAFSAGMLRYCIATVKDDPRPGMMVIFTFEFAILLIFSLFTLLRYVLALTEARVLKQQTKAKMDERRAEIRAERERLEREREESTDPESLPPLPSEEDVDENEIDVPGWEEKRRWLFGLELATGPSPVFRIVSSKLTYHRFHQAHCLYRLLWNLFDLYGTAHAYHSRRLPHLCILRQARTRLQQLPKGHPKHEQSIPRCHQRRADKRQHLHRLQRSYGAMEPARCCRPGPQTQHPERGYACQKIALWPHSSSALPQSLARTTTSLPNLSPSCHSYWYCHY